MAYITKRGNSYSVRYTYEDEHGKSCDKWESFPTKEEATNRKKQIEHELAAGTFLIPSSVTVAEFLMDWLPKQCSKHKWAPKTYESNLSTIQNLIIPYIGSMEMQKLKPYHMENLYTTLSKTPCGSYIEGKKQELTEKQKQRFLSGTTIHEVHRLLGTAFQYAVEWGILVKSPVPVDSPKKSTQERTIWTVEEMRAALDSMEDPILHLAVHLTLVGALREGEIVGLTPEDLDFDAADGIGTFRINKSIFMKSLKLPGMLSVKSKKGLDYMDMILKTTDLCKNFKGQMAVNNVSLNIRRNSVYGLLGPNGAGKSTILKMLTGILRPTSGSIEFDGHPWKRNDLEHIGALIEMPPLYENLTAYENLKVRTTLLGLDDARINEVLQIVRLTNTGKKRAGQFSLGMKQRLGIAIALLNSPQLLILDEPTNGLDPLGIEELRELIRSFPCKGITVILSSHILSEVQQIADHVGIIADGVLGYEGELRAGEDLEQLFMDVIRRNGKEGY